MGLADGGQPGTYKVTATAIEACSCPLFCSCYYNTKPTDGHMCRFNNAYKYEQGSHWGKVDLPGASVRGRACTAADHQRPWRRGEPE